MPVLLGGDIKIFALKSYKVEKIDPHIHWQQILTLNTAHRPRWFPKNVDSPQEWVES